MFVTSRLVVRFYALDRKLPRNISEIFNTSLVDQKAKGVGLPMLRSNHEICYSDSGQNDGKIRRHFSTKSATVTAW